MAIRYQTPGVYIEELPSFPDSVVAVPTSIPAFIGYTETTEIEGRSLRGLPTRINSLGHFQRLFGGAPDRQFKRRKTTQESVPDYSIAGQQFFLFNALRMYFDNGGGPCWIVSVGQLALCQDFRRATTGSECTLG